MARIDHSTVEVFDSAVTNKVPLKKLEALNKPELCKRAKSGFLWPEIFITNHREFLLKKAVKIFISGLLLCGLQVRASDDMRDFLKEVEQFRTPCHNQLYKDTHINIMQIPNKPNMTLEGQYCPRMLIRTVGDAFAEGSDLPADKLNVNIEPIHWVSENAGSFDLSALDDLNTQAARLWQKMVECHGSPDKARRAYYDGSSKCGMDRQVKSFAQSVQLYLNSTQTFLAGQKIKGRFHPLLNQLLLENISTTSWLPTINEPSVALSVLAKDGLRYLASGRTLEQLETMSEEEAAGGTCFCTILRFQIKTPAIKTFLRRLNARVNSFLLLSSNESLNECESIGLWPGVSRAVVKSFEFDEGNSALGSYRLTETVSKACGDVRYTDSPYSFNTRPSRGLVYLFHQLAMRDFP